MARKTRTKKGRAIYSRRKAIVEPVFGQIGTVQDGRRVRVRGSQPPAPNGASTAQSTTCSSSTGQAA